VAQQHDRALVTYNRADFEPIVREFAHMNREYCGLVFIHPLRFPSWEFARIAGALEALLEGPNLGGSFLVWLQEPGPG